MPEPAAHRHTRNDYNATRRQWIVTPVCQAARRKPSNSAAKAGFRNPQASLWKQPDKMTWTSVAKRSLGGGAVETGSAGGRARAGRPPKRCRPYRVGRGVRAGMRA